MTAPYPSLNLEPVTTVDRVVGELRRGLFEGELEPGTPLREVALADALGVGRSTVREALGLLVAEGLADRVAHRGTVVRELDLAAITDVGLAREVIETAGVRRWVDASTTARSDVRRAWQEYADLAATEASAADLTEAHLAIHRGLAALTGSPRLLAVADSLYAEVRLALARVDRVRRNAREQVHTHAELLDLLEAGRLEDAVAELGRHLAGATSSMARSITPAPLD